MTRRVENQFGVAVRIAAIEPSRWKGSVLSDWWIGHQLGRHVQTSAPHIIHARGSAATIAAIRVRRFLAATGRIVFDYRGDEVAEALGRCGADLARPEEWTLAARTAHQTTFDRERRACEADSVIAVSNAMLRLLQDRHNVPASRIRVQPCCVDFEQFPRPDREDARQRLGLTNELVVAYLGSLEWYQLPNQSLRLFKLIRTMHADAILLAITSHPARMRKAIADEGIDESACRYALWRGNSCRHSYPPPISGCFSEEPMLSMLSQAQ